MTRSAARALVAVVATVATSILVAVPTAGASRTTPHANVSAPVRPTPRHARYRTDRVLVKFKSGVSVQRRARSLRGAHAQAVAPTSDVQTVAVPNGDVMGEVARLKKDSAVEYAQPDYIRTTTGVTPTASQWAQQWDMQQIDAPDAWTVSEGDGTPVVAVIDTGIDYNHPDLAANVWDNTVGVGGCATGTHGYNFIDKTCVPLDDSGHGTHVSGTIGAAGSQVVGVNWRVQLMALKALDSGGGGYDSDLYRAIEWVVTAKTVNHVNVRVINASWGGGSDDPILDNAIADAHAAGILFVAAAGNEGFNNDMLPDYPCASRYVLCVAASDETDNLASFSNYGRSTVALAAPGTNILSTWYGGTNVEAPQCNGQDYCYLDGTSMATPHVTGAAALVSQVTGLTGDALRNRLVSSVDVVPGLVGKVASNGRLDLCRALASNGCAAPVVKATQNGSGVTLQIQPVGPTTQFHVTPWQPSGVTQSRDTSAFSPLASYAVNQPYVFVITPVDPNGDGPATVVRVTPLKGGYLVDGFGGLHPFANASGQPPPLPNGGPYWGGWNIARGVAVLPSGAGGYVLDGWGGLHAFGVGSQAPPPAARITGWWPGWDIARGVAFTPDGTGGYVVDGFGGLHPFAVGSNPMPPAASSASYWQGWDIVRGVATVPSASLSLNAAGGLVLDGYGGIHPFAINGKAPPPPNGGPYWRPWDIARGITVSHDGKGGYIGDGWGAIHPFALSTLSPPLATPSYWQGWDISEGPAL